MFTKKPYKSKRERERESDMCVIGFQNHIIGIIEKKIKAKGFIEFMGSIYSQINMYSIWVRYL